MSTPILVDSDDFDQILLTQLAESFRQHYLLKGDAVRIYTPDLPDLAFAKKEEVVVMIFKGENPCENARRFFKYMRDNDV